MKNVERARVRFTVTKSNASQLFRKVLRNEISLDEFRRSQIEIRTTLETREIQITKKGT